MADGRRPVLLDFLRRLMPALPDESGDAHLLERFVRHRDEAAFTALLRRHGPLVWGVCRRVLPEEHAAEDAFQATFLVLVRKAGSVSKQASVRSWLYGVAVRVAVRARRRDSLRRARERLAPARRTDAAPAEAVWEDVRPILDEEIRRLPEKYRLPVVLCYLEGRTNDEAARILNCPRGTIATRLARARQRLRGRLARRGLALSAGALAALLSENPLSAALSPALLRGTTRVALLVAGGTTAAAAVPASITTLTEGVLHAMSLTKLMTALAVVVALTLAGGVGVCAYYLRAQEPPGKVKEEPRPPAAKAPEKQEGPRRGPGADKLTTLLQKRLEVAEEEVPARLNEFKVARGTLDSLAGAAQRRLKAELELSTNKAARVAAREKYLKVAQEIADHAKPLYEEGRVRGSDYCQIKYLLVEATIDLEREKARK
jgi:RNA polymerase sigma factor (sigma-70 family)